MDAQRLRTLLQSLTQGETSLDDAVEALSRAPGGELGYANVDLHRALRTGHPEVIYGAGKAPDQIVGILRRLREAGQDGLVTRVSDEKAEAVRAQLPELRWHAVARVLYLASGQSTPPRTRGAIAVICAGTSDLPVAEEAAVVAEAFGNPVERINDVGVAGLHRLLGHLDAIRRASVLIAVAGMEGALPGVVAGLVDKPVIAVPTSVGYGANFGGLSALLTMLNSCAAGISVVNIDNGFGAAMVASRINRASPSEQP